MKKTPNNNNKNEDDHIAFILKSSYVYIQVAHLCLALAIALVWGRND